MFIFKCARGQYKLQLINRVSLVRFLFFFVFVCVRCVKMKICCACCFIVRQFIQNIVNTYDGPPKGNSMATPCALISAEPRQVPERSPTLVYCSTHLYNLDKSYINCYKQASFYIRCCDILVSFTTKAQLELDRPLLDRVQRGRKHAFMAKRDARAPHTACCC